MAETPLPEERPEAKAAPKRSNYDGLRSQMPGNSKKGDTGAPKKEITKLAAVGEAREKEPGFGKKLRAAWTGDDTQTIRDYVLFDVIIPGAKDILSNGVSSLVDMLLFGGGRGGAGRGARRGYSTGTYARYSTPVNRGTQGPVAQGRQLRAAPEAVHNFDDIVLDNRGAAEEVIDALDELIKTYDVATVSDLKELVGLTPKFNDENWGWTSMVGAHVTRERDGYGFALPRTQPLD